MPARRSERACRTAAAQIEGATRKAAARPPATEVSAQQVDVQRLGNQGAQRALRRAAAPATQGAAHSGHSLQLGDPGNPLERDADRVADQVTGSRGTSLAASAAAAAPQIQRVSGAGSSAAQSEGSVPASVQQVLAGGGQPLAPALQADMGQRFGRDFSAVRVHQGPLEARSARDINAHAYTAGQHVVFGEGRFAPHTPRGRHLLAHELAHTVQQSATPSLQARLIQRDFAIAPTVPAPAEVVLTEAQMRSALQFDQVVFTDAAEIEVVRDVLGISRLPAVVDEAFVNAVLRYQGQFGLTQDGKLGPRTAEQLSQEITAEADYLGQPVTGGPLRRAARRLLLRSMTSRTLGRITHQGFVGPDDDNLEGAVTVREGDTADAAHTNAISLEYTGENSDRVEWLQFLNLQMFATPPAGARVFNTGVVGTTGGDVTWSDATTTNWAVDSDPADPSPLYSVTSASTRAAARRIAMLDQPGGPAGLPIAQAFTAPGALADGATRVTLRMRFDSYVIRNNRARYHVAWTATTYNIMAGTSSAIDYAQGAAGVVTGPARCASHRAVGRVPGQRHSLNTP